MNTPATASPYGLKFSKPRIVMTKTGEKSVENAEPTEAFWDAWRSNKEAVRAAGFSLSKDLQTEEWKVARWSSPMTREQRAENAAMSRAADLPNVDVPKPDGLEYLPYQKAGVSYGVRLDGVLIADEMGLGKTIQAIGIANVTKPRRILVICPASLRLNWRNEIQKWQTIGLPVHVMQSGCALPDIEAGWVVINYDILKNYQPQLKAREWDLMIADECHYLKNSKAQRTKFVLGGGRKGSADYIDPLPAKRRVFLTGTPILNRPVELWTLIHALDPERWSSYWTFAKRYCGAYKDGYGIKIGEPANLPELQARLRETIMVRRLKKDVLLELPPKRRQVIALEPSDAATRKLIERERAADEANQAAIAAANYDAQKAESEGSPEAYVAAVRKLRNVQAAAFAEMAIIRHEIALAKLPDVIEHLGNASGKCVVFAHHRDVVAGLVEALKDRVVSITGDTKMEDRQDAVTRFQTDPAIEFFVGNMQAAGVGLTLTASDHVVFAELDWVPGNLSQAEDRCHRIGQRKSVLVQHIVLDGSLDARMAHTLISKQATIDKALNDDTPADIYGGAHIPAPEISTEQPGGASNPIPGAPAATDPGAAAQARRERNERIAASLTVRQVHAIHEVLRILAAMDSDRARVINAAGFSKMDTQFGCELAAKPGLTRRQAAAAMRMVRKYRRQYSPALYAEIFPETDNEEEMRHAS